MQEPIRSEHEFSSKEIVQYLLESTGTFEPPTNADLIARSLQLEIRWFFHEEYNLDKKIRAYLLPARREIGIARTLSPHRRKFSILHEVGHYVNPAHWELNSSKMIVDDDRTLKDNSVIAREIDANRFAADCIFQLDRFQSDVSDLAMSWSNISLIARIYDTSVIATARRWVECSQLPCAILVFVPKSSRKSDALRFSYMIASESFKEMNFARLPKFDVPKGSVVVQAYRDSIGYTDLCEQLPVEVNKQVRHFDMPLFATPYGVYGLIAL